MCTRVNVYGWDAMGCDAQGIVAVHRAPWSGPFICISRECVWRLPSDLCCLSFPLLCLYKVRCTVRRLLQRTYSTLTIELFVKKAPFLHVYLSYAIYFAFRIANSNIARRVLLKKIKKCTTSK